MMPASSCTKDGSVRTNQAKALAAVAAVLAGDPDAVCVLEQVLELAILLLLARAEGAAEGAVGVAHPVVARPELDVRLLLVVALRLRIVLVGVVRGVLGGGTAQAGGFRGRLCLGLLVGVHVVVHGKIHSPGSGIRKRKEFLHRIQPFFTEIEGKMGFFSLPLSLLGVRRSKHPKGNEWGAVLYH
jgi:hypothetical protein